MSKPVGPNFTHQIQSATPGSVVWDRSEPESVTGLHVRFRGRSKSYYLTYRSKDGVQRRPKIGDVSLVTVAKARKLAREWIAKAIAGSDEMAIRAQAKATRESEAFEKQKAQEIAKSDITIEELFQLIWDSHWNQERFHRSRWAYNVRGLWERNIQPHFSKLRISEVTDDVVSEWHRSMADKPYAANRALEVLSTIFKFAEKRRLMKKVDPSWQSPCKYIEAFKERKRSRHATDTELRKLHELICAEPTDTDRRLRSVAFLRLILLTGSRPIALERARNEELKIHSSNGVRYGVLTFFGKSSAETGEAETVIFTEEALTIVEGLPPSNDGRLIGCSLPQKLWRRLREEAGCPDLWARDYRRSFASAGLSGGVNRAVIGELLNHRSEQTTRIYAKLKDHARVAAAQETVKSIKKIVEPSSFDPYGFLE